MLPSLKEGPGARAPLRPAPRPARPQLELLEERRGEAAGEAAQWKALARTLEAKLSAALGELEAEQLAARALQGERDALTAAKQKARAA